MSTLWKKIKGQLISIKTKGAAYIFVGNTLTKFVAFFGSIFVVGVLTKGEYGTLGYVENLFSYAYLLAGLGMTTALLRYVVLAESIEEKNRYYSYIVSRSFVFNILLVGVAFIAAVIYPHPGEFTAARVLLPLLLVSLPFHSLVDSNTCMYRAMFDNKRFALLSCVTVSMVIVLKYVLAYYFKLSGAVIASLIVYAAAAVFLFFSVRHKFFRGQPKAAPLSREQKITVLKYSLQYMVTNGIWALFMLNDIFLLSRLTGDPVVVANYKVAYMLPGNLSLISTSIGLFVAPYFVHHENDYAWVRRAYKKTYAATAAVIFLAVAFLYIFAEPILDLLYSGRYTDVAPIMRLLLIAVFINNGIRYTNAHLLSSMGQVKYNMYISLAGVLLQVIINLWTIPNLGVTGVAYTSIFVYSLMSIALIIVFNKKYFSKKQRPKEKGDIV